jgi:hypothetical protein
MPDLSKHRVKISENPDGTWSYRCACGDSKNNLMSKSSGAIIYKSHIAFSGKSKK